MMISIVMNLVQGVATKKSAEQLGDFKNVVIFTLLRSAICAIISLAVLLILERSFLGLSINAIWIGFIAAVCLTVTFICSLLATKSGSLNILNIFLQVSMIVPCAFAMIFFGEQFKLIRLLGIILLVGASVLMVCYSSQIKGKISIKDIVLCSIAMLTNGLVMVTQKYFTVIEPQGSASAFNLAMFFFCAVFLVIVLLVVNKNKTEIKFPLKKVVLPLVALAVSVFLISQFMTILAGKMDASILYPVVTGSALIATTFISAIVFKEKIKLTSIVAILVAIGGIVLLQL